MKTDNLSVLKINKLTQEQYDAALASGRLNSNELYLTPEEPIDLSPYATKDELETAKSGINSELAGKQATITGAATTITSSNLTVNRALISDNAGKVAVSTVTSTELGNLSGVTSNIQTQLNNKLSTTGKAADASKLGGVAAKDYATTASVETKFANLDGNVTGSGNYVKTISQTDGKITATLGSIAKEDIPDHTDTDGNFGKGDGTKFGHLKLSDSIASDSDVGGGIAATPKAVKQVHTLAGSAKSAADGAKSRADSAYELAETKLNANAKAVGAADADKLGGKEPSYYATASDLNAVSGVADAAKTKSEINEAAINVINNTSTGILANAKKYTNEQLNSYSKTADIAKTYETISNVSTKIQAVNQAISTEAQTRSGADELLQDQINTFIGTETNPDGTTKKDAGKSIRTIANEELAAQLIPESAKESLDTLQEIAAWIQGHPDSVSAMNADILDVRKEVYGTDDGKAPASGDNKGKSRIDNIDTAIAGINNVLAGKQATITGAATTITGSNLDINRALISDNSGKVAVSAVTSTELSYLDGVTSAIQTQLNNKLSTTGKAADASKLGGIDAADYALTSAVENADNALGNRITALETSVGTGGSVETRIAAALGEAKEYADKAEEDAIKAAEEYANGKETAITQAYNAKIEAMVATSSGSGNFIKAISQTDGKVSYTKGNISASEIPQHTFNSTGTATTGFLGNNTNYGHLKLSDTVNSASDVGESSGTAATPKAVGIVQENVETLGGTVNSLSAHIDKINVGYGTCTTAAATAAKVVTLQTGNAAWKLETGSIITVLFSNTNTAASPTLNVNGTGAKPIRYTNATITDSNLNYGGYKNRPITYMYDGNTGVYHFISWGYESGNTNTQIRIYRQGDSDWNKDYPIVASRTVQSSIGLNDSNVVTEDKYTSVYGLVPTTANNIITINPTTGLVKANKMDLRSTLNVTGETSLNTLKVGGATTHTGGHVYLTGVSGTSTANTTQLVFGSSDTSTQHVALSSNDNALVINPNVSATTPNQIVLYLNSQSKFPCGIIGGAITTTGLTVNGTSTLATLSTSGKATLNSLEVSGTSKLTGALTASSASFSSGVSVDGQFTANGAAIFNKDYGVQIGSGVKLTYDDTKKCLNFTFL